MPDIRVRDVSKYYGSVRALAKVDLAIHDGDYTVLLGPSGCGKTTLLKIIAGILEPTSGNVRIGGKSMTGLAPEDRHIGFVFQNYALFPHLPVVDNAAYGLIARGENPDKARRIATDMLGLVHLEERTTAIPRELSGGMQQRLAMARALSTGSKLLLLDEPMNALDAYIRKELRVELRKMVKKLGLTAIHVTHDQEEAMALADKVVIMRDGRIMQVGTPQEVYNHPINPFVANFLGEANFLRVHFEKGKAKLLGVELSEGLSGDYIAAIRPENMHLGNEGAKIKVANCRLFGPYYRFEIDYNGMRLLVRSKYENNDAKCVTFDPKDVLLFKEPEEGLEKSLKIE
jgi:ABC-type Fe3+/spermidine/putrescine transport system ATPase subunit